MISLKKTIKKIRNFLYGTYQSIVFLLFFPLILFILVPICRLQKLYRKFLRKKPRILWAPNPIINIVYNSRADKLFGYESNTLVYSTFIITEEDLFDYNLEKIFKNPIFYLFFCPIFGFSFGRF